MRILIVRNNYNPKAIEASLLLEVYLATHNITCLVLDADDLRFSASLGTPEKLGNITDFDLCVVLGGDGTILRTAAQVKYHRIPILGINFGNLGFMANPNTDGVIPIVSAALADELIKEYRTNLCVKVFCEGEDGSGEDDPLPDVCAHEYFALNEVALARGAQGRIIDFSYMVAGSKLADTRGDGLIIATATGSTGYALSAGGPLVSPTYGGLIVVPIAPHSLHSRPVLTEPSDVVEMSLHSTSANRQASMFIDGELIATDEPILRVVALTGEEPTVLLRYKPETFYAHASKAFFR